VEACSGGRDGTFFAGEGCLVASLVELFGIALHVVREGELTEVGGRRAVPRDETMSIFVNGFDGSGATAEEDDAADFHFFAGTDEAPPMFRIAGVGADKFDFTIV